MRPDFGIWPHMLKFREIVWVINHLGREVCRVFRNRENFARSFVTLSGHAERLPARWKCFPAMMADAPEFWNGARKLKFWKIVEIIIWFAKSVAFSEIWKAFPPMRGVPLPGGNDFLPCGPVLPNVGKMPHKLKFKETAG